jgi:hypothetical protein
MIDIETLPRSVETDWTVTNLLRRSANLPIIDLIALCLQLQKENYLERNAFALWAVEGPMAVPKGELTLQQEASLMAFAATIEHAGEGQREFLLQCLEVIQVWTSTSREWRASRTAERSTEESGWLD